MPIRCKLLSMLALLAVAALAAAHPKLSSGPMIAYAEMTETAIWVQTTEDAEVSLRYWPIQSAAESATIGPVRTNAANDHIALLTVTGLPFGTKFGYEIRIDNQPVEFNHPLEFQTQPHWRWATNPPVPPEFTFALGSCAYINDTPFDRPGRPYGDGMQIFESIHKLRPELMLWMGDNVYFREADWLTPSAMRYRWRQNRALPEMQPLLASTAHYAIWDDHDYGPNDSDWTFNLRPDALQIFREYFPSLQSGLPDTPGVFFRFVWGDVEFFMLDNRYHRTPNRMPNSPEKVMMGREQMKWLRESLVNSNATFKFVVQGGQMINPIANYEAWALFPDEQQEFFRWLATSGVSGVVFLSGDRHASELLKIRYPNAPYDWFEFTCSPLTAGPGRDEREANNEARVPGTWVNQRNFGTISVSGPWRERVLTLRCFDSDGNQLWEHEIRQQDLQAPRN